jgi:oxaloacetate decarboxylase alpha subunit
VVTQAAINVATGARYKLVIDELILHAQGAFGDDSGFSCMDQDLRDRLLDLPRAAELAGRSRTQVGLEEVRTALGGPGLSDEDLLLRYVLKGDREIAAMRAAGPPRRYGSASLPLLRLIEELGRHKSVRYLALRRGEHAIHIRSKHAV